MSNKKFKRVLAVALLSTMGLVACSNDVQAKPSNYDDPLIAFTEEDDEVYNNLVSIIDDAYRDGTLASAVLDKILYVYATSVFGTYNRIVTPAASEDAVTLKEAARDVTEHTASDGTVSGATVADKFLESHKAYWSLDDDGNRAADVREYRRITAKWQTIEDRISRSLYGDISGGSYSTRGYFSEEKFLKELKSQLHHVADAYATDDAPTMWTEDDKVVITPDVDEENVFEDEDGNVTYLHRENYQSNGKLAEEESADAEISYVEDELIPVIYRSLLVEQYLVEESYNNLGRSAARKVNVLAISDNANSDTAANYLMKFFVREKISKGEKIDLEDFKEISNAMKGLLNSSNQNEVLEEINTYSQYTGAFDYKSFTGYDGQTYYYYNGTDFGDMMKNYEKIKADINLTDTSVESDFTGSYTYDATIGKEIKENEIKTKDYTIDGWFSESSGLSDLPDSIKTRLFNIGVSNVLDNEDIVDRWDSKTATYSVPSSESKLVAKINGKYYLKVASKEAGAQAEDDILFNSDGKYYIIQIEEAVSGSKLAKDSEVYEQDTDNPDRKEEIINEVARIVASKDSYQSLSTKHWLEQAAIKYHDTKIYDYFKENYPDLFDD